MKKGISDATPNTVMAVAVKKSVGSDVTSVGGTVPLAGVPYSTLGKTQRSV